MMNPELYHLIDTYGYWLMAFGAIIEGETFLVAGGIAIHYGMLNFPGVILLSLLGSFAHDCFLFFLGRYGGQWLFTRRPQLKAKAQGILSLFDKYGIWIVIASRYAYGFRTIIPTVIGLSPLSKRKFIIFDLIGGILWSCTFVLFGYFLGNVADKLMRDFGQRLLSLWPLALGLIIAAMVGYWLYRKYRQKS